MGKRASRRSVAPPQGFVLDSPTAGAAGQTDDSPARGRKSVTGGKAPKKRASQAAGGSPDVIKVSNVEYVCFAGRGVAAPDEEEAAGAAALPVALQAWSLGDLRK